MLQGGLEGVGHLDGVYWTLWVELKFYATVLVLLLLGRTSPGRLLAFAAAWPLLGSVLAAVFGAVGAGGAVVSHVLFPQYSGLLPPASSCP